MIFIAMVLLVSVASFAQEKNGNEEFFLGKWQLMVEGLSTGDSEMLLVLTKDSENQLEGTIGGLDGSGTINLSKITVEEKSLTVYFISESYNVPLYLDKEDDGTVSGNMFDMFDVTGKKIVDGQED